MKRIWNDRTTQERRTGPTTVGGGGGTGGRLIDTRSRSAAGGPLLEFEGAELDAQTNTPVQTREMTRRRCEEDR